MQTPLAGIETHLPHLQMAQKIYITFHENIETAKNFFELWDVQFKKTMNFRIFVHITFS